MEYVFYLALLACFFALEKLRLDWAIACFSFAWLGPAVVGFAQTGDSLFVLEMGFRIFLAGIAFGLAVLLNPVLSNVITTSKLKDTDHE